MLQVLQKIRVTKSRNKKEYLLTSLPNESRNAKVFKDILYYTYNPLMHYGIQKLPWKGEGLLTLVDLYTIWPDLLEKLQTGLISGESAKIEVKKFINKLTPVNADLFKMILKKDLRAGFSAKTINKAFNYDLIPLFGAMLASKWSGTITGPVYMSLKLDGLRGIFKNGKMYSRNGHEIIGVDHINRALAPQGIHELDGELTIPGKHFQDISGELRSHADCPDAIYNAFDTGDLTCPFYERYKYITDHVALIKGPIKIVKHVLTNDMEKIISTFTKSLDAGYEGLVLKNPNHMYKKGTRSKDWMKVKNVKEEDLPILEFYEGEGKYKNMVGGFIVQRENGVRVRVGSGLSDDLRLSMWKKPEKYIGIIAELNYHEETKDGSLRHPVLKHLRWDK